MQLSAKQTELIRQCSKDDESFSLLTTLFEELPELDEGAAEARRQAEQRLYESEDRFRGAFEYSPVGMALVALDGCILRTNQQVTKILGYAETELRETNFSILTHPDDRQADIDLAQQLLRGEILTVYREKRYIHKAGHEVWCRLNVTLVKDSTGEPLYFISQIQAITQEREAARRLRESEERFRSAFEHSLIGMVLTSLTGQFLQVNWKAASIFGYNEAELLELDFQTLTHPDDLATNLKLVERTLRGDINSFRMEKRYIHKDGHVIWTLLNVTLIRNAAGEPLHFISQIQDVTDNKLAAERLRESEDRFRGAFEYSPVGMALVALDGGFLQVNHRFTELLGYSEAELLALDFQSVTHPDHLETDTAFVQQMLQGELDSVRREKRYVRKDGQTIWGLLISTLVRDAAGQPLYFFSQVQDITQEREAERRLQESEERFRSVFEHSPIGMALSTPEGKWFQVNQKLGEILGYSEAELLELDFKAVTYPDDLAADTENRQKMLQGELETYRREKRFLHKDGRIIWGILNLTIVRNPAGQPLYLFAQIQDITPRKQAQIKLRESIQRYDDLVASIPVMVYQARRTPISEYIFDYISPKSREIFGLEPGAILENPNLLIDPIHPEDLPEFKQMRKESVAFLKPFVWEGRYIINGETRWFHIEGTPQAQDDGSIVWNGIQLEITDQMRLQEMILKQERLNVRLEKERELSDLKSRMMIRIAHEFRTPLSTIQLSGDLLDRYGSKMQPEHQGRHIGQIKTQVSRIINMLDDISYILRAHETKAALNPTILNLEQVCRGIIANVQATHETTHRFELAVARDVAAVALDNDIVQTIIAYLLNNAVQFSAPDSTVYLDVMREEKAVVVRVRDEGIGIPPAEQERLFEPFFRAGNIGEIGGLGLGLAVVKRMVEQHGGSVAIDSDVNQGATFTVRLPLLSIESDEVGEISQ